MDKTEQLINSNFKTTNHNVIRHNYENANIQNSRSFSPNRTSFKRKENKNKKIVIIHFEKYRNFT